MTDIELRISETIVDPRTGEILQLATVDDERLVETFLAAQEYERHVKTWRTATEDELVRRANAFAGFKVGAYEVDVATARGRDWDPKALDYVLRHLVDMGLLSKHEIEGIVILERRVDGKKALALLNDLDGEALQMVRDCFTWKKGRTKVEVTSSATLEP